MATIMHRRHFLLALLVQLLVFGIRLQLSKGCLLEVCCLLAIGLPVIGLLDMVHNHSRELSSLDYVSSCQSTSQWPTSMLFIVLLIYNHPRHLFLLHHLFNRQLACHWPTRYGPQLFVHLSARLLIIGLLSTVYSYSHDEFFFSGTTYLIVGLLIVGLLDTVYNYLRKSCSSCTACPAVGLNTVYNHS